MQFLRASPAGLAILVASHLLCSATAVGLRGRTGTGNQSEDALSAAMSVIKAVSNQEHAQQRTNATASTVKAAAGTHLKLDVGFAAFESNLTAMVDADIRNATSGEPWTAPNRDAFVANVTTALAQGLKQRFTPLKKSIGKTWMALPQDEQKDMYISQLKNGFASIFAESLGTIENHMQLGLHRFALLTRTQHLSPAELLVRSEVGVNDSLLGEHCYADAPIRRPHGKGAALVQEAKSAMLIQEAIGEAFCIQPVVGSLVHRLNDQMELISMTMRFQAGAMGASFSQQARKK